MNDNLTIKIKKNTKKKEPISIFYYNCEKNKYLINNKINIFLEENSEAEINEIFFSNNKSIYWNNVHNYISLKKNSKLWHYKIQLESAAALHSSSSNVDCENSSVYNSFIFSVGGGDIKNKIRALLRRGFTSINSPRGKDQEGVLLFTLNSGVTKTLKVPGFAWARTAGQPRYIDYEVRSVDKKVNASLSRKIDYSDLGARSPDSY